MRIPVRVCVSLLVVASMRGQTLINGPRTIAGPINYCADSGSNDTYACNVSPAVPGYVAGACYTFKANTANVGPATINLNSLGAKTITMAGATLPDNAIRAAQVVTVCYDGTNMQLQSPPTPSVFYVASVATGDGTTDDATAVQTVINQAAALGGPGSIVDFGDPSKVYAVATRITLKPFLTYRCNGATVKTRTGASSGTQIAASIYGATDNITVTGCTFNANSIGGALLFNVDGGGSTAAQNITVTNCTFMNTKASPAGGYDGALYSTAGINNVLIQFNKFVSTPSAIELKNPNVATIDGNQFDTIATADAISLTFDNVGSFARGNSLRVTNNRARRLSRMLVEIWASASITAPPNPIIADNIATDWVVTPGIDAFGISVMVGSGVSILRNSLYGGLGTGYCIESGTDAVTIQGNTCVGFHDGIAVHQGTGAKVLNNTLREQTLSGIRLTNTNPKTGMLIDGNEIWDAKEFGIWAEGGSWGGSTITSNKIRRASGYWSGDASTVFHGIAMTSPNSAVTVSNNFIEHYSPSYISGWGMVGLRFNGSMSGSLFDHNTFINRMTSAVCPCDGVLINSNGDATGATITHNVFEKLNNASNGGSSTPASTTGTVIISCSSNGPIF